MKFAKLFEREEKQVLIKVGHGDDEKPEVRFFFEPEGLDVCSVAITYKDSSEENWKKADKFLDEIDEEKAFAFAENFMEQLQ